MKENLTSSVMKTLILDNRSLFTQESIEELTIQGHMTYEDAIKASTSLESEEGSLKFDTGILHNNNSLIKASVEAAKTDDSKLYGDFQKLSEALNETVAKIVSNYGPEVRSTVEKIIDSLGERNTDIGPKLAEATSLNGVEKFV